MAIILDRKQVDLNFLDKCFVNRQIVRSSTLGARIIFYYDFLFLSKALILSKAVMDYLAVQLC